MFDLLQVWGLPENSMVTNNEVWHSDNGGANGEGDFEFSADASA
jgi:hypothetical protein